MTIHLKLPQKEKVDTYIPTDAEVEKILEAVKGSPYEIAIWLAVCGMRKSEIIAITSEDLNGNMLTISKAKVINDKHEYVEKTTKTTSSTRTIWIPDYVADLLRRKGFAYEGFPGNILRDLHRVQDRLGINRCKLHALRHYYVSHAHSCGVPDAYIAEAVGHASINTTRNIYLQAQQDKSIEMQKKAMSSLF